METQTSATGAEILVDSIISQGVENHLWAARTSARLHFRRALRPSKRSPRDAYAPRASRGLHGLWLCPANYLWPLQQKRGCACYFGTGIRANCRQNILTTCIKALP